MRKFIDTKHLSWPLTPELKVNKSAPGEIHLYLSPDIALQKFDLGVTLNHQRWKTEKERRAWAKRLRQIADEIYPEPLEPTIKKTK